MLAKTLKRTVVAGVAAVVLGGAAVGPASAQGAPMTPSPDQPRQVGGHHHHGGFERGVAFGIAAQAIGVTPQQLRTELPGKSLAEVAQAHGKIAADIATALKNAADQRIDQAINQVVPQRQPASPTPAPAT